jgi:hypothetical protein
MGPGSRRRCGPGVRRRPCVVSGIRHSADARTGAARRNVRSLGVKGVRDEHSGGGQRPGSARLGGHRQRGPPGVERQARRHVRLYLSRGPGPDFSGRDRAVLTLVRPHLHQA